MTEGTAPLLLLQEFWLAAVRDRGPEEGFPSASIASIASIVG